jgi:muramoyltetrapeptide carboxypeptidase LdcA involved in peptidoglycan recycling
MDDVEPVFPPKLRRGSTVRVVAPAASRAMVMEHDHSALIDRRFADLGLRLSYGEHVDERDDFDSSSIASRIDDLHSAFADPDVDAVLTVIGGFSSNELLPHLNWDLIAAHPKVFCGHSDITALQNAILARTGLVTYSGPHWSSFGMRDHFEQTLDWFARALFEDEPYVVQPATHWTDDLWFLDQDKRTPEASSGWWPMRPGSAEGRLVGGNLCTYNLLQGGPFRPSLDGTIVLVEDDFLTNPRTFARDLASLLQLPDAAGMRGLLIGRFQRSSELTRDLLSQILDRHAGLADLPVLANVDFGHTSPQLTLPVGGRAELVSGTTSSLRIVQH